eukprot:TRINITY_DN1898_c0_g1_i1.p1 TRINITY_DN1898_c0_g1~~TRINITY_DN1898_c0_g1_i1.p1  ORF type:complete len:245 (+),score=83.79 TRINITY_DN1898_c0_g1_i1:70-804(+)
MAAQPDLLDVFAQFNEVIESEFKKKDDISTSVKEVGVISRKVGSILLRVQKTTTKQELDQICAMVTPLFEALKPAWQRVTESIANEPIEKYRYLWKSHTSNLVFAAAFRHWLETHTLITIEQCQQIIGGPDNIDVEDYLLGVTNLPRELSRLCMNCVTAGNYELPIIISKFVSDLYSAFQMLNLRNDALRKRYDAIKYDVQRIDEVMYDISVRKLVSPASLAQAAPAPTPVSEEAEMKDEQTNQ